MPHGSICMLAGASGVGKTAMASEWMRRLREGKTICQAKTNVPNDIGVIVGDRRWRDHHQWFTKAGCPDIKHYSFRDDRGFNWDSGFLNRQACQNTLKRCLDMMKLEPGGVLLLDPIALFIPGNLNDYKMCAAGIGALDKVILERQITVIGLAHMGKQKGDPNDKYVRPQDRILGSTALLAFSDTPMYLLGPEADDSEGAFEFGWVPHHAPESSFLFKKDNQGLFVPYYAAQDTALTESLYALIPTGEEGITTKDLEGQALEVLGMSRPTLHRRLKVLEGQGRILHPYGRVVRKQVH